jgi:hypothetical protein
VQYLDLSFYRDGDVNGVANVYPQVKNVGWLGEDVQYSKGSVPFCVIEKLKELIFCDLKNAEDRKHGIFDKHKSISIHQMHMRGNPYPCPFCDGDDAIITVKPGNLKYYSGEREVLLGMSEILIPSLTKDEYYSCPTMIYHYVEQHCYVPPKEFTGALNAFHLDVPFDADEAQSDLTCIEMPMSEVEG